MKDGITYVGIDAHQKTLHVAVLVGRGPGKTAATWTVANEPKAIKRLVRTLENAAVGPIQCCYEAGPVGYALQRQLTTRRLSGVVVAPHLIPRKPGERIKTDRRDAQKLAELLRAGLLTAVQPPTPAQEAVRDLCRARDDAREDLQRARHRLGKFLLRRGLHYPGRNWSQAHRRWVAGLAWPHAAAAQVVEDYRQAIDQVEARLQALDRQIATIAAAAPYREPVGWLRCFRGLDTLSAMLILAELHDVTRFRTARALMGYVGVVPSEDSSAERVRRGRITKTGNALLRRVLVETAWHYRHRAGVGRALARRRTDQPAHVIAIAEKAQVRLCRRYRQLSERRMLPAKITVAIARELAGFLWAALQPKAA